MTEIDKNEALELSAEEMNDVAGGANRYKRLAEKPGFIIYKVVRGDNLTKIARAFNCTQNELLLWNPKITNKNQIYAGEYLYIRA